MSKRKLPPSLPGGSHDEIMQMYRSLYELDENPIFAFEAFILARFRQIDEGEPIPNWILDHLESGITLYLAAHGGRNLEECLGVSRGRGKEKAFAAAARDRNWYRLMVELKQLRDSGMSVEKAAAELADILETRSAPELINTDPDHYADNEPEIYTAETIQSTYTHTWARRFGDDLE